MLTPLPAGVDTQLHGVNTTFLVVLRHKSTNANTQRTIGSHSIPNHRRRPTSIEHWCMTKLYECPSKPSLNSLSQIHRNPNPLLEEHRHRIKEARRSVHSIFFTRRHECLVHGKAMSSLRLGSLGAKASSTISPTCSQREPMEEHRCGGGMGLHTACAMSHTSQLLPHPAAARGGSQYSFWAAHYVRVQLLRLHSKWPPFTAQSSAMAAGLRHNISLWIMPSQQPCEPAFIVCDPPPCQHCVNTTFGSGVDTLCQHHFWARC